jgi:enolase
VIDELDNTTSTEPIRGLAYVYMDYKDQMQQSASSIISSFVKQLALRLDSDLAEVRDLQKTFRFKSKRPELDDLIDTVIALLHHFPSTYAIFDALDECEFKERIKLLKIMDELAVAGVKVFATCRPHVGDVRQFFETRGAAAIWIKAETGDIKNFLRRRVEERTSPSPAMKAKIVDKLSLSAGGV